MKKDISLVIKKVSLCSLDNIGLGAIPIKGEEEKKIDDSRKDTFYFIHILFWLMGLMHYIPFTFFITANAYWMYKFRNLTADITDTDARTVLQTHFSAGNTIVSYVCTPIATTLSAFFGYKIIARTRVLSTLGMLSLCFIMGTVFVGIDTDSWQTLFFALTMIILAIIAVSNATFSAGNLTILSRFPPHYMKYYLLGQGFGNLCSSILQIISLSISTSTEGSALIYFISGSSIMSLTLLLFYLTKYNALYNFYISSVEEDVSKKVIPLSEIKAIVKQIWGPITALTIICFTLAPVQPNITTLVVSENYGSGSLWSDKYFVPVITFLYSDIIGILGRMTASRINKTFKAVPLTVFMLVRMCIFIVLIYLCNAQPRHHLPVFFHHDWEYAIILGCFSFSSGYIINMTYLDVTHLVEPEKVENAYLVTLSCASLASALVAPIALFSVDLL